MVPGRYKRVNLENTELGEKEKEIFREVVNNGKSLLLIGGVGTGKTHFAALVYNYSKYKRKVWIEMNDYILELYKRENLRTTDAAEYLQSWWDMAMYCDFLVIDDLGVEENTEKAKSIVSRILLTRYNYQKQAIITTNLNGEQLKYRYSERLISRIYEDYMVVVMNGKDRRREKFGKVINL